MKDALFPNNKQDASVKSYNNAVFQELHNDLTQKYEYELSEKDVHAYSDKFSELHSDKFSDHHHQEEVIEDNPSNITYDEHLKEGLKETFVDDTSSDYQYSDESSTQDSYSISEPLPSCNNESYIVNEHFPFIPASEWARIDRFGVTNFEETYQVRISNKVFSFFFLMYQREVINMYKIRYISNY